MLPSESEEAVLSPAARIPRPPAADAGVDAVLRPLARAALELTRADGAYVEQVVDDEHVEVVAVAGTGAPPPGTRVAYPGSVTREMVEGGLPVNLAALDGVGPGIAPYLAESCRRCAALLAPLLIGHELLGALVLLRRGQHGFDDSAMATVRSLSDLASASLRLLEDTAREREERTALLDSTAEGIYGIDPEGRCTFMNRSAARLLGYEPNEVLGANMHELIHHTRPDGSAYPAASCPIYRATREGEAVRVESEVLWRRDGTSFSAEYASHPIREDERVLGAVVTFRDISERKRAEEDRARRLERERFLAEASNVLASSLDYQTTLDRVARLAVPRIADYCVIDVLEDDRRLHRVGVAHVDPARQETLATARPYAPGPGSGSPALIVVETGEPEFVPDVSGAWLDRIAQNPEHRELMADLAPRSVIIVPLSARGQTVGLLWLARVDDGPKYDQDDVALATELGRRAGVAVDNAGLYSVTEVAREEAERRAREEEALRAAIGAVAASASTEEVILRIADSALRATNADGAFVERIDMDHGETVVVASAGATAPPVDAGMEYAGSFTEHVVARSEPTVVARVADAERRLPPDLVRARPDDAMLVLPLVDGGEPIGALFLIRHVDKPPFRGDEMQRALSFAELAALAFRRIHMLEESERRREELQRVMESRARLMRGFSHDVKNPLGAADGYLQILEDEVSGPLTESQAEQVGRARRAVHSSLDLIADLLDLARAEAGELDVDWGAVDVRDAARDLGEEYRAQAERKGLTMSITVPDEMPVIRSDPARVRQVLGNLFSNAVKYTAEGEVRVEVELRTAHGPAHPGDWIATEVRDTGPGLPADEQRLLFQEFSRLDPGGGARGAGVGLAISQRIAHALGGEITVESEPGQGSAFTFWLPCMQDPAPDD